MWRVLATKQTHARRLRHFAQVLRALVGRLTIHALERWRLCAKPGAYRLRRLSGDARVDLSAPRPPPMAPRKQTRLEDPTTQDRRASSSSFAPAERTEEASRGAYPPPTGPLRVQLRESRRVPPGYADADLAGTADAYVPGMPEIARRDEVTEEDHTRWIRAVATHRRSAVQAGEGADNPFFLEERDLRRQGPSRAEGPGHGADSQTDEDST